MWKAIASDVIHSSHQEYHRQRTDVARVYQWSSQAYCQLHHELRALVSRLHGSIAVDLDHSMHAVELARFVRFLVCTHLAVHQRANGASFWAELQVQLENKRRQCSISVISVWSSDWGKR